jgi:hypothetical protein
MLGHGLNPNWVFDAAAKFHMRPIQLAGALPDPQKVG